MRRIDARRRALIAAAAQSQDDPRVTSFRLPYAISKASQMQNAFQAAGVSTSNCIILLKRAGSIRNRLLFVTECQVYFIRADSDGGGSYSLRSYWDTATDAIITTADEFLHVDLTDRQPPRSFETITLTSSISTTAQFDAFVRAQVTVDRPTIVFNPAKMVTDAANYTFLYGLFVPNNRWMVRKYNGTENTSYGGSINIYHNAGESFCVWQPEITGG